MKIHYYQVYNNGVGDLIEVPGTSAEVNRRKGLPRHAVELEQEIDEKGLEGLRADLIKKHTDEKHPDVAVMFCYKSWFL